MKFGFVALMAALVLGGCATSRQVATMEGQGKRAVFNAPYEQVWRAAVDAAQVGDLQVTTADRGTGYIAARRGVRVHTFGENVGIWVKQTVPGQTQVEVLSRQAGPPKFWFKNWENQIFDAITANLTREAAGPGIISDPSGVEYRRETEIYSEPIPVPSAHPPY